MPEPVTALPQDLPSPCFVVDAARLRDNGRILNEVQERSGAKVILALKGFATWPSFPLLRGYLTGTTASSLNEARLASEEFGGEVHVYAVAYAAQEFSQLQKLADHISFNSLSQWEQFKQSALGCSDVSYGLRINPEYSEVEIDLYNPCVPGSRFGVTADQLNGVDLSGIDGLHFHTLCEQGADVLGRTLDQVEAKFGHLLPTMKWLNLGGGHHITKAGYDLEMLIDRIQQLRQKYDIEIILEPGEAVGLDAGYLASTVLDVFASGDLKHAILDVSASAHMPDVLEMPYRPHILQSGQAGEKDFTYQLGGNTCLAGDRIGSYSFDRELQVGDQLVFTDMAIYSMVKTTMFNGVQHPALAVWDSDSNETSVCRTFGYQDYKDRLGG